MSRLALAPGMTVQAARRSLSARFRAIGCDSPELDARLLIGHALGCDHSALVAQSDRLLNAREIADISAFAARREKHEPVARILGSKEFWSLPLQLDACVLVPRPDTETVVEAALAALDACGPRNRALRIADLGVGSGALLLALLSELPNAIGIGTDRDGGAIAVARRNADMLGLGARATFAAGDFGAALAGGCDLVVSNPPYIPSGDIAGLAPDVREFDPHLALDGGADGLACYRAIATDARRLLTPNGTIVVEIGIGQAEAVAAIFNTAGLAVAPPRLDLGGVARAISAAPAPPSANNPLRN